MGLDFFRIKEREGGSQKKPVLEVYPDFIVKRSNDLMVRGRQFHAIWDEENGMWSTDEYRVAQLVDAELRAYQTTTTGFFDIKRKFMSDWTTNSWMQFRNFIGHVQDSYVELDTKLTFKNTEVKKEDYVSKRLPYDLAPGDISAWDEIVGTLYDATERQKIEWAIGAIVSGDSVSIQKFLVFYGAGGTGKGTILQIIEQLFEGYVSNFVARDLTGGNNQFALEGFKSNPLVAIDQDGDLSKIQDNTRLNSVVSHEKMLINEKGKPQYRAHFIAMPMVGSNSPVKITDARSGIIRRLIDVQPTGNLIAPRKYQSLIAQIPFELGAIAHHCLTVYREMGKHFYSGYTPVEMMLQTDVFFNFIEEHYDIFKAQDGVTLKQAYELYRVFCDDSSIDYPLPKYKLREELKNYFEKFEERATLPDGSRLRSYFSKFNAERYKQKDPEEKSFSLVMEDETSLFDLEFANCLAQYSNDEGTPQKFWDNKKRISKDGKEYTPSKDFVVSTKLSDIDTSKEHFVKVPENLIVIDFDLTDAEGNKSMERNLEAASAWPSTYAEFSKSGGGVHLHYYYEGDATQLSAYFDEGIEVKVFTGNLSLRRRVSKCNNVPIAVYKGSLPEKEKKVMNSEAIEDEKHLRSLIEKALRKEVHPGTKSNVDFIFKVLDDMYKSGKPYDVTNMRMKILNFASDSTNQAPAAIKLVQTMSFKSEDKIEVVPNLPKDEREVIFDVEVFPNLFVVCWMYAGPSGYNAFGQPLVVKMINPDPHEMETLMGMKLVGFNCRKYDNHIIYGRYLGYSLMELYKLSQKIITNDRNATFAQAYGLSYTDIYDYSSKKQSLKKWEIELGIAHLELGLPWDEPVDEKLWKKVVEYCVNDVVATEKVHQHLKADFIARQILADLSGLSLNHTTQQHTAKIVFGEDRNPQDKFVYTDLSEMFPGYKYGYNPDKKTNESVYRGEITGEGGYVYAEPGMYSNVALLDVASMHPTSIEALNLFGEAYTENFSTIKRARIAIKNGDLESARKMFGGRLARYLNDEAQAEALSYALKIVINIVYGLTSAKFDNAFRDPRNIDNIVAKRGALFMIELKHAVQEQGFQVVHIKTDSIKIPNATREIIEFIMEFGERYGYTFEHEETYEKFCLVNDAVYIAYTKQGKKPAHWVATGAQFAHPFVFKTLFSKERITFRDKCEEKHVTSALYLDFEGEDMPMVFSDDEKLRFVGKAGLFTPIMPGHGGALLLRKKDDKFYSATGAKGYRWLEADTVKEAGLEKFIDMSYFTKLVDEAKDTINKFGDFEWFVGNDAERDNVTRFADHAQVSDNGDWVADQKEKHFAKAA